MLAPTGSSDAANAFGSVLRSEKMFTTSSEPNPRSNAKPTHRRTVGSFFRSSAVEGFNMQNATRGFDASHTRTSEYRYRRHGLKPARLRASGCPGTGSAIHADVVAPLIDHAEHLPALQPPRVVVGRVVGPGDEPGLLAGDDDEPLLRGGGLGGAGV